MRIVPSPLFLQTLEKRPTEEFGSIDEPILIKAALKYYQPPTL
jgi:hypothetical protein